jgi:signal transduction histidine kinase
MALRRSPKSLVTNWIEHQRRWSVAALLVFVVLATGSWAAASIQARGETDKARREFRASSAHVASTLQLALQHEEDLIVSARGFAAGNPNASNPEFVRWATSVQVLQRYPELVSMGYVRMVPRAQLAAIAAAAKSSGLPGARASFHVTPPGSRPFYCFAVSGFQRTVQASYPPGFDLCAVEPLKSQILSARDSGLLTYLPYAAGKTRTLGVFGPVYLGGTTPSTVGERRAKLLGWVGTTVVPSVVLARVLESHPGTSVTMHYGAGSSNVLFSAGVPPKHPQSLVTDLHNGWTVASFAPAVDTGVLGNGSALALLGAGLALSVLLALLISVLGTGRTRAIRLVDEKTHELRTQAEELEDAQKVLVELDQERQRLLARTVEVAEAERIALASDLHDGPIQHLTAVTLQLDLLAGRLARGDDADNVTVANELRESVADEMVSLRRLMIELRPPIIEQRGIEIALRDCAQGVLERESIEFELDCALGGVDLVPELETAIYRVVRESLTNIRKHADARHARVTLAASEARVLLTISDDGDGFHPDSAGADRFGLITMREGIEAVGGTWKLETSPGTGTRIEAALPLKLRARRQSKPGQAAA